MADPRLAFIKAAAGGAQKGAREFGVPASVTLAQACLESGFGRFHIGTANNYFGIKAFPRNGRIDVGRIARGFVIVPTKEVVNGRTITINARFRRYSSLGDSMRDHGSFLRVNPRYKPAFAHSTDANAFARALQRAGYATDPQYADKLISIMRSFDLYRFDKAGGSHQTNGHVVQPEQPQRPQRPVRPYIAAVQRDLNTHLKRLGSSQRLAVDGVWDPHTARAFRRVCRVLGVEPKRSLRTFRVIAGSTGARTAEELELAATQGSDYERKLRAHFAGEQEEKRARTPAAIVGGTPLERRQRARAYVAALQRDLNWHLKRLGAPEQLEVDGDWGENTGRAFRRVCRILGVEPKRSVRTFRVIAGSVAERSREELERAGLDGAAYEKRLEALFGDDLPGPGPGPGDGGDPGDERPSKQPRTFRIESPHVTGSDIKAFQRLLNERFKRWGIDKRIDADGEYGMLTRRAARQVAYGLGVSAKEYARGVTPELRTKLRTPSRRSPEERTRAKARRRWLRRLRRQHEGGGSALAVAYARSHLGLRETSQNRGPLIDRWNRASGSPLASHWCGNFMNGCLMAAGFPSEPWLAVCRTIEGNAMAGADGWEWTRNPVPGDLALFTVSGAANHVGMVESVGPAQVVTIEGNTHQDGENTSRGYGVFRRHHARGVPRGYARPPYGR